MIEELEQGKKIGYVRCYLPYGATPSWSAAHT